MGALEAAHMAGHKRNGAPFADYFQRWDLTAHYALGADGELRAFMVSGTDGRGAARKVFIYELHVAAAWRRKGLATALLGLAERSSPGRGAPTLELNVHSANEAARMFYQRAGFAQADETDGGGVLVLRRKRS